MYIKILFVIIAEMLALSVFGQYKLGIGTGVNYSYAEKPDYKILKMEGGVGYYFSLSNNFEINRKWSIVIETQYILQRYVFKDYYYYAPESRPMHIKENYIRLNPQLEFKPVSKLSFLLGTDGAISISEKQQTYDQVYVKSVKKLLKNYDFGISAGIRYYVDNFFFSGKYTHGIKDITSIGFLDINDGHEINKHQKSRLLQFGIGYFIL